MTSPGGTATGCASGSRETARRGDSSSGFLVARACPPGRHLRSILRFTFCLPELGLATSIERYNLIRMSRDGISLRLVLATILATLVLVPIFGLALADYQDESVRGLGPISRARAVLENGDRTHYAFHLAVGRMLDLCSCTQSQADAQYWRASFHARTPRELMLVNQQRPATPIEWITDAADILTGGMRLGMRGFSTTISGAVDPPG